MIEFINGLKSTSYYKNLILNPSVVLLYVGGSQCVGMATSESDYDLIAIVDDVKAIDVSDTIFLTYKGKKVHWYYWPLDDFLSCRLGNLWNIGMVYFRNVNEDIIIYKNTKYANLISKILEKKLELSMLAIYKLLSDKQSVIIRTIAQMAKGRLECYTKLLYHLCLAIWYLTGKMLNTEVLFEIKSLNVIINDTYLQILADYLNIGLMFMKDYPIDYRKELIKIHDELSR